MRATTYGALVLVMAVVLSLGLVVCGQEGAWAEEQAASTTAEPSLGAKTWQVMKEVGHKTKEVAKETAESVGQTAKQLGRSVKKETVQVVDKTGEVLRDPEKALQEEPKK